MEEDVFNALQTRTAYIPGGFDREGKIIFIVNIINDLQLWNRKCLEISIQYLKKSLSPTLLQNGVTVIVDAQKCSSRITRTHSRTIYALFGDTAVSLYLVRSEGFWEKHVEPCTKSHTKGEPIVLSKARLCKYFELSNLPAELDGTLQFNYDLWLQQRKSIDEFQKTYEQTMNVMENLHVLLLGNKSLRPSEADQELRKCTQLHAMVQRQIEAAIDMGNSILLRLNEAYPLPSRPHAVRTAGETATATATTATTATTKVTSTLASAATATTTIATTITRPDNNHNAANKQRLPPDLSCERNRIELRLNEIERRQTSIRTAWLELLQSIRDARELASLEEGVAFVTNWILNTAEQLLSRQQAIGCDMRACEELRSAHNALEMECRETYGFYAELLYKIDKFSGPKDSFAFKDLLSQRDFMQFVCRSFATRLERRRNVLITSQRFYRLVSEYFERTSAVFESLVMGNKVQDFGAAAGNLQKLKDSQTCLANLERELTREGEKLSDMLAMPVKDALGRDLHIDYSEDIANIRDILDTSTTRRNIFSDSVELQKLTLEQVTHIHTYEQDARMATQWMDDLYDVMIRCHSHVGCNIHEIQVQKDELQTFQETGKSIFHYGSQLLEASQALRLSCKLDPEVPQLLLLQLQRTWHSLQAISQEHMTRLRVSAVFHRSVEEYSNQLHDLKLSVLRLTQSGSSSSGVSSENESQSSPETLSELVDEPTTSSVAAAASATLEDQSAISARGRRHQLRKCLELREQLLVEVGRMVRLGRLLKTRLKEPFILDIATGKSAMADDLTTNTEVITSPSTTVDSGNGGSELNTTATAMQTPDASSTATSPTGSSSASSSLSSPTLATAATTTTTPTTLIVTPTGNNAIACNAITNKLTEISEVAESLDAAIRDAQDADAADLVESLSTSSSSDKKLDNQRSTSMEDWHSRSTEDESFVTASEGNFTPHSHSSSYATASGRTSSFISSDKNLSFDASEADDTTFAYEMPELTTTPPPLHDTSFESSEQSYLSAQQLPSPSTTTPSPTNAHTSATRAASTSKCRIIPIEIEPRDEIAMVEIKEAQPEDHDDNDQDSIVGIEELHSRSVTPTPHYQQQQQHHYASIPIESETEQEASASCIADAPSMETLTEVTPIISVTPEVSTCAIMSQINAIPVANTSANTKPPNAAWRRNKYYENITKQTIKGFL